MANKKNCFCTRATISCGGFESGFPINSPSGTVASLVNIQNGIFNNTRTWAFLQPSQCGSGEAPCYGCIYLTMSLQAYNSCSSCGCSQTGDFPPECPAAMTCCGGPDGLQDTIVGNFNGFFTSNIGPYIQEVQNNPSCFPTSVTQYLPNVFPIPTASTVCDVCNYLQNFTPFANNLMAMTTFTSSSIPTNTPSAPAGTLLFQQQLAFFNAMQTWPVGFCTVDCSDAAVSEFQNTTGPALSGAYTLIEQNLALCYLATQIESFRTLAATLSTLLPPHKPTGQEICDYFNLVTDTNQAFNYQFMLDLTTCPFSPT